MKGIRNIKITRECKMCGKKFHPLRSSLSQGTGFYCSVSCASSAKMCGKDNINYRGGGVGKSCVVCGKIFTIPKAWEKRGGRYCSRECMGVDRRGDGCESFGFVSWPPTNRNDQTEWANAIKNRDGWKCRFCGDVAKLNAHHIKGYWSNPKLRFEIDNGITLCKKCHGWVHTKKQLSKWYFDILKESSEAIRLALLKSSEDMVRSAQRCVELHRTEMM